MDFFAAFFKMLYRAVQNTEYSLVEDYAWVAFVFRKGRVERCTCIFARIPFSSWLCVVGNKEDFR